MGIKTISMDITYLNALEGHDYVLYESGGRVLVSRLF